MPRSPEPARSRMLDAALELFAVKGIGSTSLREIRLAAGQRNAAALQYHFGDKRGLLLALLERELPALVARREELLAVADDARGAAAVVVLPFAELATGTEHERRVVRFLSQLHVEPDLTREVLVSLIGDTRSADAFSRLCAHLPEADRAVVAHRFEIALSAFLHAAAQRAAHPAPQPARGARARAGRADRSGRAAVDDRADGAEAFRSDLVDMFLGSVVAR